MISHAVWLYTRFALNYRDVEEGFKSMNSAQQLLLPFFRTCNLCRPRRHLLPADEYRTMMQVPFRSWSEITGVVCA